MQFVSKRVSEEYQRCIEKCGAADQYESKTTVGIHTVLRAHYAIADHFVEEGKGIAGIGPRDLNLLHSALHRQFVGWGSSSKWKVPFDVVATLMYGLIMDHPFHDANKRTAFLVAIFHLENKLHSWIDTRYSDFEEFTVAIAEHQLIRYPWYQRSKLTDEHDKAVECIALWLKKNTRKIDRTPHSITYWDLNGILNRFGFCLQNPHRNQIEIHKKVIRPVVLGIGHKSTTEKVGQVSFPSWKAQVGRGTIRQVRELTKLDEDHRVDSRVFFEGVDSMLSLITEFEQPLSRLADR